MFYRLRVAFALSLMPLILLYTYALANPAIGNNVTDAEKRKFDNGTLTALSVIREKLGKEDRSTSLGAAGIRVYLVGNGVDIEKYSLDIEAFLGQVALYALRTDDGFWDAYVWSSVDDTLLTELQKYLLLSYDSIDNLCTRNLYMFFGFSNNANDNGYAIESSDNAKQLYQLRFEQNNRTVSASSIIPGLSDQEADALNCFMLLRPYLSNSAKPIQSYSATVDNPDYLMYMIDVSAENGFGGTISNTYFIVYDSIGNRISVISFDKVVTHFNDIGDKNTVYAKYLSLSDGLGDFLTNQLSMDIRVFSSYLKAFYDVYYK